MAETKTRNIYQRMSAITAELRTVAKDLTVQTGKGGGSYKAVSERDVLDAVKPLEERHGVFSFPFAREIVASEWMEQKSQYGTKLSNFIRTKTIYRFVNIDAPDEFVDVVSYGDGIDSGDKAAGKAMTYCDKYALLKAYKISTGDDPVIGTSYDGDKDASENYNKRAPETADDKPSDKDWDRLYNLAATAGGANKPSVDASIKKKYKCEPEELSVAQFDDFYGRLESRAAKMKAERAAAAAPVEE